MKSVALGDIVELNPRPTQALRDEEWVSFLPMAAIGEDGGGVIAEDQRRYGEVKKGYTSFNRGDLLLAKITPCFENGKLAIATISREVGFGTTEFHVIRPDASRVDTRYLFHFLRTPQFRDAGASRMTGAGGQRRVPVAYLSEARVPLPPLAEQRRISDLLDNASTQAGLRGSALGKLADTRKAAAEALWSGPVNSNTVLGELADVQGGLTLGQRRTQLPLVAPYLRVANVQRDKILVDEIKTIGLTPDELRRTELASGDILVVEGNGSPTEIGRAALWSGQIVGCVHQNHLIRVRCAGGQVLPEVLLAYLNSVSARSYFERRGKTTSGLVTINLALVRELEVSIPPMSAQREYKALIDRLHVVGGHIAQAKRSTLELVRALQRQCFS